MSERGESDPAVDPTTLAVRGALRGEAQQLEWLLERFTPLLMASARRQLWRSPGLGIEPEDLVQDVWAIAIPRLGDVESRDGRHTPVLLSFLATTMRLRLQTLFRVAMRHQHDSLPSDLERPTAGIVTRLLRGERTRQLLEAIDGLDDADREVVVMRAIEQIPNHEVALVLGLPANTAAKRYGRALDKLRHSLRDCDWMEFQPRAEEGVVMKASESDGERSTVDPRDPSTYCKWNGRLEPVGFKRCNPETNKVMVCKGNDQWDDTDEDCPPGGYAS